MATSSPEQMMLQLKGRLREIEDLISTLRILEWDQSTYMPAQGAEARGRQMALLNGLAHQRRVAPELGVLLDALEPYTATLPYDSDEAALVRLARREYDRSTKVPAAWVSAFTENVSSLYNIWTKARPADDFSMVRDGLARNLDLSRQFASFLPHQHPADVWIDQSDPGMTAERVRALFAELRAGLVPLVQAIAAKPLVDDSPIRKHFPGDQQLAFGVSIIKDYGYDFTRGRQDLTHHPFMTRFSSGDVRITTRIEENFLNAALFGTLHEAGHALYELGIDRALDGSPLGGGASSGVHESQSRMWENIVGRSRGFWGHYYPALQAQFPQQLGDVPMEAFYRAINQVKPSLIRVEADEVTYNLHVMIRFELELQLLEGSLNIDDLPEAWRAAYQADLGVSSPTDKDGVLQDVHWYGGQIGGAFQGYTIGNMISAQLYEAALAAHPSIPDETAHGQFGTLRGWMVENVHRHGAKFTTDELVERATGRPLEVAPLLRYLNGKYGDIYGL